MNYFYYGSIVSGIAKFFLVFGKIVFENLCPLSYENKF